MLIKVPYEAICATDIEILDGVLGYYKSGLAKYPIIPGHKFSGRVAQVGADAENFREGNAVVAECIQSCGECKECRKGNFIACYQRKELGVIGLNGDYAEYFDLNEKAKTFRDNKVHLISDQCRKAKLDERENYYSS